MEESRKGLKCFYSATLCQEGYCSECALSPFADLRERLQAAHTRLENTIIALVKEHYRLTGKPYYEDAVPGLELLIKGEG